MSVDWFDPDQADAVILNLDVKDQLYAHFTKESLDKVRERVYRPTEFGGRLISLCFTLYLGKNRRFACRVNWDEMEFIESEEPLELLRKRKLQGLESVMRKASGLNTLDFMARDEPVFLT